MARDILWVDDDPGTLQSYRDELEGLGFKIRIARTADEMWQELHASKQCLAGIILDVLMPIGTKVDRDLANGGLKTGLVLLEQLKSALEYRDIPVIFFTIRDRHDVDEVGTRYGVRVLRKQETNPDGLADAVKEDFS